MAFERGAQGSGLEWIGFMLNGDDACLICFVSKLRSEIEGLYFETTKVVCGFHLSLKGPTKWWGTGSSIFKFIKILIWA